MYDICSRLGICTIHLVYSNRCVKVRLREIDSIVYEYRFIRSIFLDQSFDVFYLIPLTSDIDFSDE